MCKKVLTGRVADTAFKGMLITERWELCVI